MLRRTLILTHLFLAAFLAPMFILVAVSGGLYLIDQEGSVTTEKVPLPESITIDFQSGTLESDIRAAFKDMDLNYKFDSIRSNATRALTRPSTRTFYEFTMRDNQLTLTRNTPSFQRKMIELHKGHGPNLFILYQKFAAIGLLFVVLSGFWLGYSSPVLRAKTALTSGLGLVIFLVLGFLL